jgi:hypothetical protein
VSASVEAGLKGRPHLIECAFQSGLCYSGEDNGNLFVISSCTPVPSEDSSMAFSDAASISVVRVIGNERLRCQASSSRLKRSIRDET